MIAVDSGIASEKQQKAAHVLAMQSTAALLLGSASSAAALDQIAYKLHCPTLIDQQLFQGVLNMNMEFSHEFCWGN